MKLSDVEFDSKGLDALSEALRIRAVERAHQSFGLFMDAKVAERMAEAKTAEAERVYYADLEALRAQRAHS